MKRALLLVALAATIASCNSIGRAKPESREPLLEVSARIADDAPTVSIGGDRIRTAEHRVVLRAGRPVSVELTSDMGASEFDPLLEARPLDGTPGETLLSSDAAGLGLFSRLELMPERDGEWVLLVGDEQGRAGSYRLLVRRIFEREVFVAQGEVETAIGAVEQPASLFCPVREGRRYRVDVVARGFPAHLVAAAPGVTSIESNDGSIEFVAARSGHAVVQVASLSIASGAFELRVVELW